MQNKEHLCVLIEACRRSDGRFGLFKQHCFKNPEYFFKCKDISDVFNQLSEEEKDIFKSIQKFFDLLVECGYKTVENTKQNLRPVCVICGNKTNFINLDYGYKKILV